MTARIPQERVEHEIERLQKQKESVMSEIRDLMRHGSQRGEDE